MRNNRGAGLTTKASCYHFISGHGVLNLVFAPSKQLRDKSHNERGGGGWIEVWCFCNDKPPKPPKNCLHKTANHTVKSLQLEWSGCESSSNRWTTEASKIKKNHDKQHMNHFKHNS